MKQTELEIAAELYGENNGYMGIMEPLSSAFEAGAKWQKEQLIDMCILINGFIKNAKAEEWCVDHYKEEFKKLLEPFIEKLL
ncbi:MAG: hypothetical protein AABY22_37110 [Nanoarchaeota archaeon]